MAPNFLTNFGTRGERPEHVLHDQDLAVAAGEAPMPMVGMGIAAVMRCGQRRRHRLEHDRKCAGLGDERAHPPRWHAHSSPCGPAP